MQVRQRRHGSVVAAGTAVVAVTYGLIRFGYGLYLPVFTVRFGLPAEVAGGIAAGSFAAYCAIALLAQRLIGLGRSRQALWVACALAATGATITAAAWSAGSLAVGVVVAGSGAGAASPALVSAVAATVPRSTADRSQAVVNSGTGLGVVVGGLLAAALPGHWRLSWMVFALATVAVTWRVDWCTTWAVVPAAQRPDRRPLLLDLAPLHPLLLAALLAGAGSAAVWTFGRDLLVSAGASAPTSALLWSVLGGAGVAGALSGDVVRRVGPHAAWVATAGMMAAATVALVGLPGRALPAATALAAFGAAYVVLSGLLIACATVLTPRRAAESTAALFIALTAGQALGAAALGGLADASSSTTSFLSAACLLLCSAAVATRQAGLGAATPAARR